jgi:hypothetical protein
MLTRQALSAVEMQIIPIVMLVTSLCDFAMSVAFEVRKIWVGLSSNRPLEALHDQIQRIDNIWASMQARSSHFDPEFLSEMRKRVIQYAVFEVGCSERHSSLLQDTRRRRRPSRKDRNVIHCGPAVEWHSTADPQHRR